MSHIDVYRANIVTLSCSRSKRNAAAAAGLEGAATAAGRAGLRAGLGWGQARAAPRGRQTRANPHELASNEESTRTCCGRAAMVQARLAGMDPAEIYINMQRICSYM